MTRPLPPPSPFGPALWLAAALFLAKAAHWSLPEPSLRGLRQYLVDVGVSAHQDVLVAVGMGLLAAAALRLAARSPRAQRLVWRAYLAAGVLAVVYAVASVQIFAFLRSPLTYPLLYLAGDMKNMRSSVGSFLDARLAALFVGAPLLFLALSHRTARALSAPPATPRGRRLRAGAFVLLGAALAAAHLVAAGRWKDRDDHLIVKSPHWELVASTVREWAGAGGARIDEPYPPELLAELDPAPQPPRPSTKPRPRNVVMYVMESTGARYLSLYGSRYDTTPSLVRESARGLAFDAFYCHIGMTANSVAALTLSIYPYMTWREYTVEYPTLPGESLAEVARRQGLRTAFLHTGDLDYVNQRQFLSNRGFDVLRDLEDLGAPWISSWGGDDRDLVDATLAYVDEAPDRPFFALAWNQASHHPYEPRPGEPLVDFFAGGEPPPDDYDLGRYLNTIRQADREIGRLFDGLRERGLAEDTLVVVTGDHGEAFGAPHPTWGHGFRLYQEGIRIPLLLWSPRLFAGGRSPVVGGHVDVNPTVADLMGWPASPTWQGRSLFDPARPPRTYFYAANDDYLLGLREGRWKYIYNATRGGEELYDLERDPEEQYDRASEEKERCRAFRQRLAAWRDHTARHLDRLKERMTASGAPPSPILRE
jgi:arylsulfatase A-like enzyme